MMKRRLLICAAAAASLPSTGLTQPSSYPNKPIRIVVPQAPGGGTDILARNLAAAYRQAIRDFQP
jgi:tripartite-type tricarboxylate transporter receptor subunit TctC